MKINMPIVVHSMTTLSGDTIEFTPFTRKQFKELNSAVAVADERTVYNALVNFMQSIITTPDVNVMTMPYWDACMLFIRARSVSVSEVVQATYICTNLVKKEGELVECDNDVLAGIVLPDAKYDDKGVFANEIEISEGVYFAMRSPNIEEYFKIIYESDQSTWDAESVIVKFITSVYDKDNVDNRELNDKFEEDLLALLGNLTQVAYDKIVLWFENLPDVTHKVVVHCTKCGGVETDHMRGLRDFFG